MLTQNLGTILVHIFESGLIIISLRLGRMALHGFRIGDSSCRLERRALWLRNVGVSADIRDKCPSRLRTTALRNHVHVDSRVL